MTRTSRISVVFACTALLVTTLLASAGTASAAGTAPILSPRAGERLPARPVLLEVRTGQHPKGFRAQLNGGTQAARLAHLWPSPRRLDAISCPTALTAAENDPLAGSADQVYEALKCPKTLLRFAAAEGAGDHCEMRNRTLLDQRVFDWLDDTLSAPRP